MPSIYVHGTGLSISWVRIPAKKPALCTEFHEHSLRDNELQNGQHIVKTSEKRCNSWKQPSQRNLWVESLLRLAIAIINILYKHFMEQGNVGHTHTSTISLMCLHAELSEQAHLNPKNDVKTLSDTAHILGHKLYYTLDSMLVVLKLHNFQTIFQQQNVLLGWHMTEVS